MVWKTDSFKLISGPLTLPFYVCITHFYSNTQKRTHLKHFLNNLISSFIYNFFDDIENDICVFQSILKKITTRNYASNWFGIELLLVYHIERRLLSFYMLIASNSCY